MIDKTKLRKELNDYCASCYTIGKLTCEADYSDDYANSLLGHITDITCDRIAELMGDEE